MEFSIFNFQLHIIILLPLTYCNMLYTKSVRCLWYTVYEEVFKGRGFTSRGQESGYVFSTAVGKIQASKR